jgi:hypothetical protein
MTHQTGGTVDVTCTVQWLVLDFTNYVANCVLISWFATAGITPWQTTLKYLVCRDLPQQK